MADESVRYAARLEVDYPDQLNRLTSFLRAIWIIPIGVIALARLDRRLCGDRGRGRGDRWSGPVASAGASQWPRPS